MGPEGPKSYMQITENEGSEADVIWPKTTLDPAGYVHEAPKIPALGLRSRDSGGSRVWTADGWKKQHALVGQATT